MDLEKLLEQLTKLETSVTGLLESTPHLNSNSGSFQVRDDLQSVTALNVGAPDDPSLPSQVLQQLGSCFVGGLLLQRRAWRGINQWCLTETIVANQHQVWPPEKQLDFSGLIIQVPPDEVRRAKAIQFLPLFPKEVKIPTQDTHGYLMMPTNE